MEYFRPTRLFISLTSVAIAISYADRSNISVAIIPMAEELNWTVTQQGVVLSAFFAGYAITQSIGGWLADREGGKSILLVGYVFWSVSTALTPSLCRMGVVCGVLGRVTLGVGEGIGLPAVHSMISKYVPLQKQSTAAAVVTSSCYIGAFVANIITPRIITLFGWEWAFWSFSFLSLFWIPFWLHFNLETGAFQWAPGLDTPQVELRDVVPEARATVRPRSGRRYQDDGVESSDSASTSDTADPSSDAGEIREGAVATLVRLCGHKSVWAIILCQYCQSWGIFGLLNWFPSYLKKEYGVPVQDMAIYTSLPLLVQAIVGGGSGFLADWLILNSRWTKLRIRQGLQVVALIGAALFLIIAVAIARDPLEGTLCVILGTGFSALSCGSISVNHLDISPTNPGLVFGLGSTAGVLGGFVAVYICGLVANNLNSFGPPFILLALHYLCGSLIWLRWCDTEPLSLQPRRAIPAPRSPSLAEVKACD